jgi:hypothetical protein
MVVVLALGGPGSVVGFDIARRTNPRDNLAVAQGMVNIAGYSASIVLITAIGGVLTVLGGFTADAFRIAWLLQYPIWAFAVVGIVLSRRAARRVDAARGIEPRPLRDIVSGMRQRRRLRRSPHVPTGRLGDRCDLAGSGRTAGECSRDRSLAQLGLGGPSVGVRRALRRPFRQRSRARDDRDDGSALAAPVVGHDG